MNRRGRGSRKTRLIEKPRNGVNILRERGKVKTLRTWCDLNAWRVGIAGMTIPCLPVLTGIGSFAAPLGVVFQARLSLGAEAPGETLSHSAPCEEMDETNGQ